MRSLPIALAALAAVQLAAVQSTPALANNFIAWSRIAPFAPNCARNPDYPIIGRITGLAGQDRERTAFQGCFPDRRSCEDWLNIGRTNLSPPFQQNSCEPRSR